MKIIFILTAFLSFSLFPAWHDSPRAQRDCVRSIEITDNCSDVWWTPTKIKNGLNLIGSSLSLEFRCNIKDKRGINKEIKQTVFFESNFSFMEIPGRIEEVLSSGYDLDDPTSMSINETSQICKKVTLQLEFDKSAGSDPDGAYQVRTIEEIANSTIKRIWDSYAERDFDGSIHPNKRNEDFYTKFYFKK